ncbi:MAG: hypothetical protein DRI33_04895 [Caldiserica bacterium]|nr:MAG: hypothetical protein DRI33_04895 [Caldisericota bacterium]
MSEVEDIINGMLRLQNLVLGPKPVDGWVLEKARENVGNIAMIRVYDDSGVSEVTLRLTEDLKIVETDEKPKHVITMHINVFLDLLTGDLDFRDAYVNGLLDFQGESYHVHALLWSKAFERLRWLLKKYRVI